MTYKDEDVSLRSLVEGAHRHWKWTADAETRASLIQKMKNNELTQFDLARYRSECETKAAEYATSADLSTTLTEEVDLYKKAQALFDDIDMIDTALKAIPRQLEIPQ